MTGAIKLGTEITINGIPMRVQRINVNHNEILDSSAELQLLESVITDARHPSCKSTFTPLKEETMSTSSKIKELTLDEDTRLLRKYDIVNNQGDLTEEGTKVLFAHLFDENKAAIVDKLKALDKADEAA
jgi:hypothetical protein